MTGTPRDADDGRGPSAVLFDFGGVLTEPVFRGREIDDPDLVGLIAFFLHETAGVYHLPSGTEDIHLLETGRISDIDFFTRLCARYAAAGHPRIDPRHARDFLLEHPLSMCPEMVDAVRAVRSAGYHTALVTNAARAATPMWRRILPDEDLFDVIVDSSEVGMRKPDPRIYLLACERLGVAPEECLFIDDLSCNVDAAQAVGMTAILCDDPVAAAAEITRRLLGPRHSAAAV